MAERPDIDLPTAAVGRAMQLAAAVHDYDATTVADILTISRGELHSVCVALAAMVDVDSKPSVMLAWNDIDNNDVTEPTPLRKGPPLRPHGTHSAFARHKGRGEQPCDKCVIGERTYQRLRGRRRRAEVAS